MLSENTSSKILNESPQSQRTKKIAEQLLQHADVKINGGRPWDIQVHNPNTYSRILSQGSLGLGESYMDGWWDCQRIDVMITKILEARLDQKIKYNKSALMQIILHRIINFQTKNRAFVIGKKHYDIGNNLYQAMLDDTMTYSCGYWQHAATLAKAQIDKLDLICRKLGLKPGMRLLDIGSGWGGLAKFAAEHYKVEVVGVTVSKQQAELAKERCRGLPIDIRLQDYRDLNENFDRIVSVGMFEHVGHKNYAEYMQVVNRCLRNDGLFLLHTIGRNEPVTGPDPWIVKYIFPNSILPGMRDIVAAAEKTFIMEDWHNFGADYDKTLMSWYENFKNNWQELQSQFDDRFYRMWTYYLQICAGGFRARDIQLWQIVFSKSGVVGGYQSIR